MVVKKRGDVSNDLPPDEQLPDGGYRPRPNGLDRATELELLDAALLGDMKPFSEIFEHYRPDLHALCLQRLNDASLAEEVVQEVFLKAFDRLPNSDHRKPIWPWLSTIAFRMCVDLQRRRSFTHYSGDIGLLVDSEANGKTTRSALDEVIASEESAELWKSLDVLTVRQHRVFLSYALDGLSCAEIAAAEGISLGSVHLLLFRARKKMRSAYPNGRPLPAIALPFSWLRWKLQQIEERIRPFLSVHGEGFSAACIQAACIGTVAMLFIAGHPAESDGGVAPPEESVLPVAQSQPLGTALLPSASPGIGAPAKPPAESQPSVVGSADSLVDNVINPNQSATPEDSMFSSITISPNYENDHTILAVGYWPDSILFVSHDGGGTWKPRPSLLLDGSDVVLPPGFPQDERIFTWGGTLGLQQSDDGGAVFRTVSLLGREIAISPSFGRRDSKILMGGRTIFEYDAVTRLTQPAWLTVPPKQDVSYSPVFSPSYQSDSTVFVSERGTSFFRCKGLVCDEMRLPTRGPLGLRFSPRFEQDGLAYAFTPWKLLFTNDRAQTFGEVQFPFNGLVSVMSEGYIRDVAVAWSGYPNPTIFVSVFEWSSRSRYPPGIYRSVDAGRSWNRIAIDFPGFGYAVNEMIVTPTGRLLATGTGYEETGYGIICSEDGGLTWARRCTPEP